MQAIGWSRVDYSDLVGEALIFVIILLICLLYWQKGKDKDKLYPSICIYLFISS